MVSQCTKFEVSRFTRYEAMNGGAKCKIWGGLGQLGVTQGQPQCHHTTSYSTLTETMRVSCTVFAIARYLSKFAYFDPPHLHLAPPQWVIPVEFRSDLRHQKTRLPGLSCVVVCVIIRLSVLVEHRLVSDGQTDTGPWLLASTADAQHRAVKSGKKKNYKVKKDMLVTMMWL